MGDEVPRHDVGNGFFPAGQDDGSGRRSGSAAARTSIHLGRVAVGEKMKLVWGSRAE
jgi:hypothetical protein